MTKNTSKKDRFVILVNKISNVKCIKKVGVISQNMLK